MKTLFITLSALLISGCTTIGAGIANLPVAFSDNVRIAGVAYGQERLQKMDIYRPAGRVDEKYPVIVFFYGGSWQSGSKEMYQFLGDQLADLGYVTVIADYRKYPYVRFPGFVEDAAKATAWVNDHIADYGGNPQEIYLSGHSAGAHIAALIVADKRYLKAEGKETQIIKAFAGLSGPYDYVPETAVLKEIFGPPENYSLMQVTTFIEGNEPPMLLLWGDEDTLVGRRNMDLVVDRGLEKGIMIETKIYPGVGHIGILANQVWFLSGQATAIEDMLTFFKKHSKYVAAR